MEGASTFGMDHGSTSLPIVQASTRPVLPGVAGDASGHVEVAISGVASCASRSGALRVHGLAARGDQLVRIVAHRKGFQLESEEA